MEVQDILHQWVNLAGKIILFVLENGRNIYIPVENTKEIYCMSEISLNTKLLDFCLK